MKNCFWVIILLVSSMFSLQAEEFTLSPNGMKEWKSPIYKIPNRELPLQVKIEYICTGPIRHNIFLQWLDENNKVIGKFLSRPPFHYPVKKLLNKKLQLVQTVLPYHYPLNAKAVRITISSGYYPNIPSKAQTTFINPRIEWIYRMNADRTLNWFDMTKPVSFSCILPPGKIGIRGLVFDSQKQQVADIKTDGNRWTFNPDKPGFYQVKFFWLDNQGNEEPVIENFYVYGHKRTNNYPVRFLAIKEFSHEFQSFVVTATPPPSMISAQSPFGFNMMKVSEHQSYSKTLDDKFNAIKNLGAANFIRYHAVYWDETEKKEGVYNWQSVDKMLETAKRHGIPHEQVIINTYGTPRWNSPKPNNNLGRIKYSKFAPLRLEPWANYLSAFSKRYPRITNWELWNEPHLPGKSVFWQESTPQQFVDLLKTGYQALKKVNPDNTIILGGIGMRYMPFYDEFVKLGGVSYMDKIGTHCGYAHKPFREIETKYNAPHKPFVETEWHANLYNCSSPLLPSEEELCFRLLVNLANLLHLGKEKIATFNVFTTANVPETARYKMNLGWNQQVTGLFRSTPRKEPRKSALALRTATDQFKGKVIPCGAWYFGDGNQQAALFKSDAGHVMMFWAQEGTDALKLHPNIAQAIEGKTIMNWEGQAVDPSNLTSRQVYFVKDPNKDSLYKGSSLDELTPRPPKPELAQTYQGVYSSKDKPVYQKITDYISKNKKDKAPEFEAQFTVDISGKGLELVVKVTDNVHYPNCNKMAVWNADSLQFALDCVGEGFKEDSMEFAVGKDGLIYKTKMPDLKGDIPAEYSKAKTPLTKSKAIITREGNMTTYKVNVASSDLYPFVYQDHQLVRFALLVNNNDGNGREGYLEWGSGIGGLKAPNQYGNLTVAGYGETATQHDILNISFQNGVIIPGQTINVTAKNGKNAAGVQTQYIDVTPGVRYKFTAQVKGQGNLEIMCYGNNLKRTDFDKVKLSSQWQNVSGEVTMPKNNKKLNIVFFTWQQPKANFEVKDFSLKAFR